MAKFTSTIDLDLEYEGHRLRGAAGTEFRLPDSVRTSFQSNYGARIPITWTVQDEIAQSGGSHPDLATHDTLGLATQAELDGHEISSDPHTVYALDSDLSGHVAAADPHTAYQRESEKGVANGYASLDSSGLVPDAQIPAAIARDSELHVRQHSITSPDDHTFPGGSTFLRADGVFASPPGGSEAFPVGSIYIAVVSTNPSASLGYGTWSAFGAGRVLVGLDSGDVDFDVAEETGGAKTKAISAHSGAAVANHVFTQPSDHSFGSSDILQHTHTTDSQGAHVHDEYRNSATTGGLDGWAAGDTSTNTATLTGYDTGSAGTHTHTAQNPSGSVASFTKSHSGGAVDAHAVTQPSAHTDLNVVQPYIVVFMWKRTA